MSEIQHKEPSGWASGAVLFAGVAMIVIGIFQAMQGLAAIIEDTFLVVTPNYFLEFDVTAWGWIHLIIGVVVVFGGIAVMSGKGWARILAIVLVVVSAIATSSSSPTTRGGRC